VRAQNRISRVAKSANGRKLRGIKKRLSRAISSSSPPSPLPSHPPQSSFRKPHFVIHAAGSISAQSYDRISRIFSGAEISLGDKTWDILHGYYAPVYTRNSSILKLLEVPAASRGIEFLKFYRTSPVACHFMSPSSGGNSSCRQTVYEQGSVPPEVVSNTMSQSGRTNTTTLISLQLSSQLCKHSVTGRHLEARCLRARARVRCA